MKNIPIKLKAIFDLMNEGDNSFTYPQIKSILVGVPEDEVDDYEDVDVYVAKYLSSLGFNDGSINDLITGSDDNSSMVAKFIAQKIGEHYSLEEIYAQVEDFDFLDDTATMDSLVPVQCKSGYKRKMVMKNSVPTWVCKRISSRKQPQTPKQKMALRKARMKAHTGVANYKRGKSLNKGKQRGMYK